MFRTDNDTSVASFPVIPPVGHPGYFYNGDPVTAQPATIVDDWWMNTVQEEIAHVIEQQGITLNKFDHTQLWQAINSMVVGGESGPDYDPFLPLTGGQIYNPGGSDPLSIYTDAGLFCRIRYQSGTTHAWFAGSASGNFNITDGTANLMRVQIEAGGPVDLYGGVHVVSSGATIDGALSVGSTIVATSHIQSYGNLYASGPVFVGTRGFYFADGNTSANQIVTNASLLVGANLNVNGAAQFAGNLDCWTLNVHTSPATIGGTLSVGSTITAASDITSGGNLHANGGNVYLGTRGLLIDDYTLSGTPTLYTNGDLLAIGNASCNGNMTVGATLNVAGGAVINTTLQVDGTLYGTAGQFSGNLYTGGNMTVQYTLNVSGGAVINTTLQVGGVVYGGSDAHFVGTMHAAAFVVGGLTAEDAGVDLGALVQELVGEVRALTGRIETIEGRA